MLVLCVMDKTSEPIIHEALPFPSWEELRKEVVGDDGRCFDYDEWHELQTTKFVYRDKREVYQVLEFEDPKSG